MNTIKALVISENYMRTNFQISNNVETKYLIAAIETAQELYLQPIVGACLYNRLLDGIAAGDLSDSERELLNVAKRFIGFRVMAELCTITTFKINNIGLNSTKDENVETFDVSDTMLVRQYFINQADFYAKRIQEFLLHNQKAYPELGCCDCHSIKKNLYSAASCGIWLGGPRGK